MATKSVYTFTLDNVSPDKAVEVLSSADFEVAQQTIQAGTKSAHVKQVSKDDNTHVYELHAVEYGKGVRGIDKSKTEQTITSVSWDLKARKSTWTYEGSQAERAKVWGATTVVSHGSGCKVTSNFNINIKVPLIGSKIEKIVIRESEKHMKAHFERLVREMSSS